MEFSWCWTEDAQSQVLDAQDAELQSVISKAMGQARTSAEPVRIAVIGRRGVGKSTWVNSVRGLSASATGAARVGADEVFEEPHSAGGVHYTHMGLILEDMPGADGSRVDVSMGDEYIQKFQLNSADACVLIYTNVIDSRMLECAKKLHTFHNVPVFLVRNKVGHDCEREVSDGNAPSVDEAFAKLQNRALEQISSNEAFRDFACPERLFLIEASYSQTRVDPPQQGYHKEFHRLKHALTHSIRDEAMRAQLEAIFARDVTKLAAERAEKCRSHKALLTVVAAQAAALPIPVVSQGAVTGVMGYAAYLFLTEFCLTPERAGIPELSIFSEDLVYRLTAMTVPALTAQVAAKLLAFIPAVGVIANSFVSATVAAATMYPFFEDIITKLEKVSVDVYTMSMRMDIQTGRLQELVEGLFPAPEGQA